MGSVPLYELILNITGLTENVLFYFAANLWNGPYQGHYQSLDQHLLSNRPGINLLIINHFLIFYLQDIVYTSLAPFSSYMQAQIQIHVCIPKTGENSF